MATPPKRRSLRRKLFHRPPPGSSPGTVIAPLNAIPTTLNSLAYSEDKVTNEPITDLAAVKATIGAHHVTWIRVVGLQNTELIQRFCELLGIHRLTVEDIINQNERPKAEHYEHYSYIALHVPKLDTKSESEIISLLIGDNFVVSFQNSAIDYLEAIRNRIQKKIGQIRFKTSQYLAYAIIDAVIDLYFPLAERYAQELDAVEDDIIIGHKQVAILEIYNMRARINYNYRILWSHQELINELMRNPESPMTEDVCVYLRDCFDHAVQILDFLDNLKETSKTLIDLHLSLQTHRSNEIIKFLTIITATFIPMTFICGVYGMNFDRHSPWNMPELGWEYGYVFSLVLMFLSAASLWIYFYKQRWFSFSPATKRELETHGGGTD